MSTEDREKPTNTPHTSPLPSDTPHVRDSSPEESKEEKKANRRKIPS